METFTLPGVTKGKFDIIHSIKAINLGEFPWIGDRMSTESWALVSWDSSVHDCSQLNKPTPQNEVIYAIIRIALRLSHPVPIETYLRKRVCLVVKRNRASLTERLRARFSLKRTDDIEQERTKKRTGITYQIVSHLPKSSEQLETRENLANLAVSHGEAYIGNYNILRN